MKAFKNLCLLALVLVVAVPPSTAGTFQRVGLEMLVDTSSAAVEGEVLSTSSYWDSEGRIIVTEAMILVKDRVFGKSASVLRVKTFGGTVGNYTVEAPGFPAFEEGERLFLFVRTDERDGTMLRVTGYQQGQFRIVTGSDQVDHAVSAVEGGEAHLVGDVGQAKLLPPRLTLSELKEMVRSEVEARRVENKPIR